MPQYFAELDENNIVLRVIVADQKIIDSGVLGNPKMFRETSMDGSVTKQYAAIGMIYDPQSNQFMPPKPFPSWTLNADTCVWESPKAKPGDDYQWREDTQDWVYVKRYGP